ncbi:MAG TPA: hypothetical protein ENH55_13410 [Aurantimonas coralicida]|uniref:Uncharacterized protein n=2 Tax=root TaxID=1 RepID=A0A9C9TFV5_9HYPH|nr:hypothetical protein [Aurantimonas coralicida]HET99641.1 hypothetical protein [Aurantimonas coralicida]
MKKWITLVAVLILLAAPALAQDTGLTIKPQLENAGLLHFVHEGVTVVSIDLRDGSVEYGEGYAADEAARVFWEAVGQLLPIGTCPDKPDE